MPHLVVLPANWSAEAESEDFDAAKVWSCFHYICESSFGVTCTHPRWTPDWPNKYIAEALAFHGETASKLIEAAVSYMGHADCEYAYDDRVIEGLLKAAIVQSEYHRGIRE